MIEFKSPLLLLLTAPWILLVFIFYIKQKDSITILEKKVSKRFYSSITHYKKITVTIHTIVIFLMGSLLITASSSPVIEGKVKKKGESNNIIFVIDASLSMFALDVNKIVDVPDSKYRGKEACNIAIAIINKFPNYKYALISFSGIAAFHSPVTKDTQALINYLNNFELHWFEKTGTNFKAALDSIIHLAEHSSTMNYQVILISDGEQEASEPYSDQLDLMKKRSIIIHTIAVGNKKETPLWINNPEDLLKGVTPRVIKLSTRKVTDHLQNIADNTGGIFFDMEREKDMKHIFSVIEKTKTYNTTTTSSAKTDISHIFVFFFALLFFIDIIFFDNITFFKRLFSPSFPPHAGGCSRQGGLSGRKDEQGIREKKNDTNFTN